jgi:type I restriction enzyme, S subunit
MTVRLPDHLDLIAGAPDGIRKLRGLILELAVRGKLVPQDPNDEPASELLKRIAQERARLGAGTTREKNKATPPVGDDEQPFAIPKSWHWVRLGSAVEALDSLRKPVTKDARQPGPYPYYGASGVVDYVAEYLFDEDLVLVGEDGAKWGVGERTAFSISGKTWVNNHAHVLRPDRDLLNDGYLVHALVARDLQPFITGTTVPKLNQAKLVSIEIPLPPIAEQHRIVVKVDELMALCDRLEAEQADAGSAQARLVDTLLATLTQSTDAADLAANWQRLAEHFATLFTSESSLDALKQSILQIAVIGKLVPQDPSDEPASTMLSRKANLPAGHIRRRKVIKEQSIETPVNIFPEIPKTWEYRGIQALYEINAIVDYADGNHGALYPRSSEFRADGVTFVTAKDISSGRVVWTSCAKLSHEYANLLKKGWAKGGDVLLTHNATVGRVARVENSVGPFLLGTSVTFYRLNTAVISPDFFYHTLASSLWQLQLELVMSQTTRNQVSIQKQAFFRVVVPPLAEQHRIVAKVDELLALVDRLKADLAESRSQQERLAATLIESALHAA